MSSSDDKRINKEERKILQEIEKICGVSFRRVAMTNYRKVENLFDLNDEGSIKKIGLDLKNLDLNDNQVNLLGDLIKKLKNLSGFLINVHEEKKLPEWIKDLNYISDDLIIGNSSLNSLPESIKEFKNINTLYLVGNNISILPEWLLTLDGLKNFFLNEKKQTLDLTKSNIEIIKSLDHKGVKIQDPTYKLHVVEGIPLDQIEIIKGIIQNDGFNRVTSTKLNSINEPWQNPGGYGVKLRIFDGKIIQLGLSNTDKYKIPKDIGKLRDLNALVLEHINLKSLPESIGNLYNLKELNLSGNELTTLPESFINLTSIQKLELNNNQFKEIPTQLWALKELTQLSLAGNPLSTEENTIIQKVPDMIREFLRKKATIRVFISHAVIDFETYRVGDLVEYLENQNEISEVYFCEADLAGNIDEWMLNAVQKCQLILFIGTNKSIFNSPDCTNELQLADKFSIPVIPLKGMDVDWPNLAEINLSRELGIEYNVDNFDNFCTEVYNYILNFKREIDLMGKEDRRKGIIDIYERFRLILDEKMADMNRKIDNLSSRISNIEKKI